MKRVSALVAVLAMLAAGCTGGGDEVDGRDGVKGYALPLPDKAPSAAGPAMGPGMEPKVLLSSSDDLEEMAGSLDDALVARRSGAFVSAKTVVGYSVDNISGYDLDSGEQLWTSDLDVGSGTVCFVSQPDRAVKQFTVAYGESQFCPNLATIRVSDGKVLKKSQRLSDGVEFEGESAGGSVNHLFTFKGKDYLVDMRGVVWVMKAGEPEPIARLEADSYFDLYPTPQGDRLIGTRLGDRDQCRVDAYAIPSFDVEWTKGNDDLFPKAKADCVTTAAAGNPAWLLQQNGDTYTMVQVDPATGAVLGSASGPTLTEGPRPAGEFNLASAANQFDRAWGLPNGDMVFVQVGGLVRYSLQDKVVDWSVNLSQTELESVEDYPLTTVLPSGVTEDGFLVSSVSNDTAVEVDAINVKTGKLAARWPVAAEYRNGFQVEPGMKVFNGGVVMSRNFQAWDFAFGSTGIEEPAGDKYDLGIFEFPAPDNEASTTVPATGPTDAEAVGLASIKAPASGDTTRAGTIAAGSRLVAYADGTVSGLDPTSGKRVWKTELPGGQRVCSAPDLDRSVQVVTLALTPQGKKTSCSTLVRLSTSDGKILDTDTISGKTNDVYRIETFDGRAFVQTAGGKVLAWKAGSLAEVADLGRSFQYWEKTPADPTLRIGTSRAAGGKQWVIEAYRLPSHEKVWSTTATRVLGAVDPKNTVAAWRGNGLWISTQLGDPGKPDAKVDDSLSVLDAKTGKVVEKTGRVRRDYLADDLGKFSLTAAAVASYQTAGFENGDVVVEQPKGVMRYAADGTIRWAVDTSSIQNSMETVDDGTFAYLNQDFHVIDGGKTVLVALSNGTSVELMTLSGSTGKITGRWKVPAKDRNGLQDSPDVVPVGPNVALARSGLGDDTEATGQSGAKLDVGYFRLPRPKG